MHHLSFGFLIIAGCVEETPSPVLDGWIGAERHFVAEGNLDGEAVAVDASDVVCALEWEAPAGDPTPDYRAGAMTEIRLSGIAGDRQFEFEIKRHDFQRDALPTVVSVVPRDDGSVPAADEAWIEWEWQTPDGADLYEQAASDGLVTLERLAGELDETALVFAHAEVGGFVSARWSPTEALSVSFTAPCEDFLLELVE